jgi:protocatechuate 3,4-dioxygenase beta subunit
VLADGAARLVTQLYVAGEPRNEGDGLYRSLPDDARAAVTVEFASAAADSGATYRAHFPIVLGSS